MINKNAGAIGLNPIALSAALTAISMALTWLLLVSLGPDWSKYAPATCTATRCFCELPRIGDLVVQPANSWSSYGYVFAGFLMIALSQRPDWTSRFTPSAVVFFGITSIFVGLGSVLLHATLTLWGQFFDVMGMYLVGGFMLVSGIMRWRALPQKAAIPLYIVIVGGLLVLLYQIPDVRRWLFAVILLSAIIVELLLARPRRSGVKTTYYFSAIAVNAAAFAIWNLDQHGTMCAPSSLFQGHAAWHLLGAASLWLTFCYYRSEIPENSGVELSTVLTS